MADIRADIGRIGLHQNRRQRDPGHHCLQIIVLQQPSADTQSKAQFHTSHGRFQIPGETMGHTAVQNIPVLPQNVQRIGIGIPDVEDQGQPHFVGQLDLLDKPVLLRCFIQFLRWHGIIQPCFPNGQGLMSGNQCAQLLYGLGRQMSAVFGVDAQRRPHTGGIFRRNRQLRFCLFQLCTGLNAENNATAGHFLQQQPPVSLPDAVFPLLPIQICKFALIEFVTIVGMGINNHRHAPLRPLPAPQQQWFSCRLRWDGSRL